MPTIIDFHTHIFPDDLAPRALEILVADAPAGRSFTNGTAAGLTDSMHRGGISKSVILPIATRSEQVGTINAAQAVLDRNLFIPFGALHPHSPDIDLVIADLQRENLRGIKFHPEYQNFYIDDPDCFPIYEALSTAGIIVIFHAGKDPGPFTSDHALPEKFLTVRRNFPALKMVAAHMGGWQLWEESFSTLCGESLYFDTSAVYGLINPEFFMKMVRKHGTDRLLFGSDSPWFDQEAAWRWIDALALADRDKERIFGLNAIDLLAS